jgi:methylenetetrahydrofolate reductase (NADPH)
VGAAVQALVSGADIEVIPLRGVDEKLRVVPRGTTITVTCSAKLGLARTLDYAERAAQAGFYVIPHLAARQLAEEAELRGFVARMADAGITKLYLIGMGRPAGRPI